MTRTTAASHTGIVPTAAPSTSRMPPADLPRAWLKLSFVAAALALGGSVVGLSVDRIYGGLTPAFLPQALAQDIANLLIATPALVISAILALRGSIRALMVWLGVLAFTVYNYVIYVFSIPFGALYPVWAAVLGLSLFALIGGATSLDSDAIAARFRSARAVRVAAWVTLVVAGLFVLIWLSEDVPALLTATTPKTAVEMDLPTNPVHALDYVFFLPAAIVCGIRLLKRRAFAYPAIVALLVFMVLTCMPILIMPFVQAVRGETAVWALLAPIGVLALVTTASVAWLLVTVREATMPVVTV